MVKRKSRLKFTESVHDMLVVGYEARIRYTHIMGISCIYFCTRIKSFDISIILTLFIMHPLTNDSY